MSTEVTNLPSSKKVNWFNVLNSPDFIANPHPELKRIREKGPIQYYAASGMYFVLGHREFTKIARAQEMGRDARLMKGTWNSPEVQKRSPLLYNLLSEYQPQMISADPPDHRRMRAVYEHAFKPRAVAALAPMIQAETEQLLAAMPDEGPVDFIKSFAAPMPLRVMRNLFELPPSMDETVNRWSSALIKIGDMILSVPKQQEAYDALMEFKGFVREHIAARRKNPGEGLIDAVIAAGDDGTMSEEEMVTNLVAMILAGHETTVGLISNGLLSLLRHRDQMERLRADRSLTRLALEEFMRFEPGGNLLPRIALEDFPIGDTVIPKGSLVVGLICAINRDPEVFEAPDGLDIGRNPNAQMTFGSGIHFCVGAPLARIEGQIAFDALLDRCSDIQLDGEAKWRFDRINSRSMESFPIRIRR